MAPDIENFASEPRNITCHIKSYGTQANALHVNPAVEQQQTGTRFTYPRGMEAECWLYT